MSEPDKAILAQANKFAQTCAELREKRVKVAELEAQLEWGGLMHYLWKARGGDVDKKYPLNHSIDPIGGGSYSGEGYFTLINGNKRRRWPVKLRYQTFSAEQNVIDMWDDGEIPERLIEIVLTKNGKYAIDFSRKKRLKGEQERGQRNRGSSLEFVREERPESGVWVVSPPGDDSLPEVAEGDTSESS